VIFYQPQELDGNARNLAMPSNANVQVMANNKLYLDVCCLHYSKKIDS